MIYQQPSLSRRRFVAEFRQIIQVFLTDAFVRGFKDGGVNIIGPQGLEDDEKDVLNKMIAVQWGYVPGLSFDMYDGALTPENAIQWRVPLWVNKGLIQVYEAGLTMAKRNKMLVWRLGATEQHCGTCLAAAEQVHRASAWQRSGIMPQSDSLECGGFRCDCYLEETDERARGRLSRIPRGKA